MVYAKGDGVPTDYVRASAWLSTVAVRGNANGKKAEETVTNLIASAQIAEAQKLSREYWKKYVVSFQKEYRPLINWPTQSAYLQNSDYILLCASSARLVAVVSLSASSTMIWYNQFASGHWRVDIGAGGD